MCIMTGEQQLLIFISRHTQLCQNCIDFTEMTRDLNQILWKSLIDQMFFCNGCVYIRKVGSSTIRMEVCALYKNIEGRPLISAVAITLFYKELVHFLFQKHWWLDIFFILELWSVLNCDVDFSSKGICSSSWTWNPLYLRVFLGCFCPDCVVLSDVNVL